MRIRISRTDIYEVNEVIVTPGGMKDENNPGKYKDMMCAIDMIYGDDEYARISGEFKCENVTTFEECRSASYKFIDELWEKGYIDISTDEKCEEYGLIIW